MALEAFGSKQERRRLAQFYAALPDGELQELFGESGSKVAERPNPTGKTPPNNPCRGKPHVR